MATEDRIRQPYPILLFVLAFAWAWAFWSVPLAAERGWIGLSNSSSLLFPALVIGAYGPLFGALVVTLRNGTARVFFRRAFQWHIPPNALLVALFLSPVIGGLAVWTNSLQGGAAFAFQIGWQDAAVLVGVLFFLGGSCNEEFGWAYAIDQIQKQIGPLKGSLLLGIIWACWHLPLFFIATQSQSHMPFLAFLITCCAMRVIIVWAYNRSRVSILVALLFHTSMNLTTNVFVILDQASPRSHQPAWWYYSAFLAIVAAMFAIYESKRTRGPQEYAVQADDVSRSIRA